MTYYNDYPTEPIGYGNPYYRCAYCKVSDPVINGALDRHGESCEYRKSKEASGAPLSAGRLDLDLLGSIPGEVLEAAARLGDWFERQNVRTWELGEVRSRSVPEARSHERLLQILEDAGIEVCYEAIGDDLVPIGVTVERTEL